MICILAGIRTATAVQIETARSCKTRVAKAVCIVAPVSNVSDGRNLVTRKCLQERPEYAAKLVRIFERYPPLLQRTMCGLDRIFVEQSFWASGYAHPNVNAIGIHEKFVRTDMSLSEWATWKERLPFALGTLSEHINDGQSINLPMVTTSRPSSPTSALYYIIAHELAHRIDIANNLSDLHKGDFATRGWRIRKRQVESAAFSADWQRPCYYRCTEQKIRLSEIGQVYRRLRQSPFVSLYATRDPMEDFAETFVSFMMSKEPEFEMKLTVGNNTIWTTTSMWQSRRLQRKLRYMQGLFDRTDLHQRVSRSAETSASNSNQ